jgi:hypothetical protein
MDQGRQAKYAQGLVYKHEGQEAVQAGHAGCGKEAII